MTDAELRELDAKVAVEVMGWVKPDPAYHEWIRLGEKAPGATTDDIPRYSADIRLAWLVVEKVVADGMTVILNRLDGNDHWTFCIGEGDAVNGEIAEAEGETAPQAICRAAILAVEGQS